jgi:hypothetical protein
MLAFRTFACPTTVPLLRILMLTYGTWAEYFVGLVKFTLAWKTRLVSLELTIRRAPI